MAKPRIKLVFFDMDGTIFNNGLKDSFGNTAPSTWTVLARHLGKQALEEEEQTKIKWTNKEYKGYLDWMDDTIKIHKKYGLTKDFFFKVINSIPYFDGVKETMEILKKNNITLCMISGSFKEMANRAIEDSGFRHVFAACEYFWDENNKLKEWNLLPCDYEGKVDFMRLVMLEHGLGKNECAFVGDGRNDIPLAQVVGTSICFNGAKELQAVCTYSVNQEPGKEDFRAVLPYLGIN
ncbi:HAD-IB family phosphatase [Candidatus Pacearchaeota archaeon]|nr:HAD-IB family phosphatase [Candidatus Pacearchaeota archaeon]MBD3283254.1 HAD-IB family phosphatase [Candidatus Pacearchaeota archaeon]